MRDLHKFLKFKYDFDRFPNNASIFQGCLAPRKQSFLDLFFLKYHILIGSKFDVQYPVLEGAQHYGIFFFFKVGCLIKKIKQNLALIVQKYFYRELHETHEICHGTNTVLRLTIQYCNSPNAIEFYCVMTYYATLFNYIAALSFN